MKGIICNEFQITDDEYFELERAFGQLTKFASWELLRKNARNSHTDDFDDINQELVMSLIRAGTYYKRQVYIEKCLEVVKIYIRDYFLVQLVHELENLWQNRTRHGANRQKFGFYQEDILDRIVNKVVPKNARPCKREKLKIDVKFATYCKAIAWNAQKSIGRKITKEKGIRNGACSLSEYDYLAEELT
jgi:hypothetical protein